MRCRDGVRHGGLLLGSLSVFVDFLRRRQDDAGLTPRSRTWRRCSPECWPQCMRCKILKTVARRPHRVLVTASSNWLDLPSLTPVRGVIEAWYYVPPLQSMVPPKPHRYHNNDPQGQLQRIGTPPSSLHRRTPPRRPPAKRRRVSSVVGLHLTAQCLYYQRLRRAEATAVPTLIKAGGSDGDDDDGRYEMNDAGWR